MLIAAVALVGPACSSDDETTTTTSKSPTTTAATAPPTSGPPATAIDGAPVGVNLLPPVGTGEVVDFGDGVTVEAVEFEQLDVEATLPGETAGAAIAVTLEINNSSVGAVDLGQLAVAASYGDQVPADSNSGDSAEDLTGILQPGDDLRGVYVFRVPSVDTDDLVVQVQAGFSANVPQFRD